MTIQASARLSSEFAAAFGATTKTKVAAGTKQTAAQVPKSGLWFFANFVAQKLELDFKSVQDKVGAGLLEYYKPVLIKQVEAKLKNARYTRVIKAIAEAVIDEDTMTAIKLQARYGLDFDDMALLNKIVVDLKAEAN